LTRERPQPGNGNHRRTPSPSHAFTEALATNSNGTTSGMEVRHDPAGDQLAGAQRLSRSRPILGMAIVCYTG
jgi:hypothetical protein